MVESLSKLLRKFYYIPSGQPIIIPKPHIYKRKGKWFVSMGRRSDFATPFFFFEAACVYAKLLRRKYKYVGEEK